MNPSTTSIKSGAARREPISSSVTARDHLIQGLAAYRQIAADMQDDAYHLLLELADGASLLNLCDNNRPPQVEGGIERSRELVVEVLTQLYGLADSLEGMHTTPTKSPDIADKVQRKGQLIYVQCKPCRKL